MAKAYNMSAEDFGKMIGDDQKKLIREDLKVQKAADLIGSNAVEVEKPAEDEKAEETEKKDDAE